MKKKGTACLLLGTGLALWIFAGCAAPAPAPPTPTPTPPQPSATPTVESAAPTGTSRPVERVDRFVLEQNQELYEWFNTEYGVVVSSYAGGPPYGRYYFLHLVDENAMGLNLMQGVPQIDELGFTPRPAELLLDEANGKLHYTLNYPDSAIRVTPDGVEELPVGVYQVEVNLAEYGLTITRPDGTPLE